MRHSFGLSLIIILGCSTGDLPQDTGFGDTTPSFDDIRLSRGPDDSVQQDGAASANADVNAEDITVSDSAAPDPSDTSPSAPPSNLRLNHLQALGTHNSYHKKPLLADAIYQWNYEHLPLDEQMGVQGIRQFELDVYYDADTGVFEVYHVPIIDEEVNCGTITECIETIKNWSDDHLQHHPFVVLVELKTEFNALEAPQLLTNLDATILNVWPKDRLITPDLIQGTYDSVRDALATNGWPRIDDVRGRGVFVLHAGGQYADTYTEGGQSTVGRVMFPDAYGNLELPYAAIHSMNDPHSSFENIQQVTAAGHLVRTRSDSNSEEPNAGDYSRYEAALASGAHFISTDYPGEPYGPTYAVNIPNGTPSGCNPVSAPVECTPEAIESGQLQP